LLSSLLWFIYSGSGLKINNILHFSVVILLVAFALFIGYKQAISAKRGEPGEDELSKKLLRRASSLSYYISIYLWLFIMYYSDKLHYETHVYFAAGILGMAVILLAAGYILASEVSEMNNRIENTGTIQSNPGRSARKVNVRRETIVFLRRISIILPLNLLLILQEHSEQTIEEIFIFDN